MRAIPRSAFRATSWVALGLAGVGLAVARLWAGVAPGGLYGGDLVAYVEGAERLTLTGTPYHPVMFTAALANDPASVPFAYLYPPPLAQAFALLPLLEPTVLASAWIVLQVVVLALLLPAVARRYGPDATPLHRLGVVLAFAASSFPLSFALYGGNVSAWVAIGVAVLLIADAKTRGVVAAGLTLLKAVPFPFLLIALAARTSRLPAVLAMGVGVAISFVFAPDAWLDWLRAWPHIAAMTPGAAPWNLSPAAGAAQFGLEDLGRATGAVLALVFGASGVFLAARDRWPAAVAAATTSTLLISPTLWDHYLAATVALVVAAWWVARPIERAVFVASWAAMFTMWFWPNPASAAILWLFALLAVCVAATRALHRVKPESDRTRRSSCDRLGEERRDAAVPGHHALNLKATLGFRAEREAGGGARASRPR